MIAESIVAAILTLIVAYLYLRSGKHATSIAVLPLTLPPAGNLVGSFLSAPLSRLTGLSQLNWWLILAVLGMAAGVALIALISQRLKKPASRKWYCILCMTYCFVFSSVVIVRLI